MPLPETPGPTYDGRTIVLHWLVAICVVFLWFGAHLIDWFPKGAPRVDARSVHIVIGTLLAAVMAYRLFWRLNGGTRLPYQHSWSGGLARLMHATLYAITFVTIGLGMMNAWIRGDSLFGLFRIPALGSFDAAARHSLSENVVRFHELGANLLLVLAAGHAALALFHQFVLKDNLLRRMAVSKELHR